MMLSLQEVKEKHFLCSIFSNFPQSTNTWEAQVVISLHHSTVDKKLENKEHRMLWLEPSTENYVKEITSELGTKRKYQKSQRG